MNERIRELADQILPNEEVFHQGDPKDWGYFFSGDELEKFALLIIEDFINEIYGADVGDLQNKLYYLGKVAKHLEKHFGVE